MAFQAVESRQTIPLSADMFQTGTWTKTESSGLWYYLKTAADSTTTVQYALPLIRRSGEYGVRLKAIKNRIRITGANLDNAPTSVITVEDSDLVTAAADGDIAARTLTTTFDGVVTLDANDRFWTTTVTTPDWDYATEAECTYNHKLTLDGGASTVIRFYAPIVIYEELR